MERPTKIIGPPVRGNRTELFYPCDDGKKYSRVQLAEMTGYSLSTISRRLAEWGWDAPGILTKPLGPLGGPQGERGSYLKFKPDKDLENLQKTLVDQDHVAAINALIPAAVAVADKQVGSGDNRRWDRVYHREMNRLARQAGLRR